MNDITKRLDDLIESLPEDDMRRQKIEMAKLSIQVAEDIEAAIRSGKPHLLEVILTKAVNDQMAIKMKHLKSGGVLTGQTTPLPK